MKYGFGIDLGGTTVKIAYFDETGTMLEKWEIPTVTANGGEQILPDIAASIRAFIEAHNINETNILGLGIGVPGPVNAKGIVNKCINLGWGVFNIAEKLTSLTGFPVKAGNDANVAALGEFWKGGGQGCDNMVFVTLGTGVGGGIVVEGNLLHGAHGSGAEIGHICVEPNETVRCNCGNAGCVEQYCSATGIVRLAKLYLEANDDATSLRNIEDLTCKDVFDAAKANDAAAIAILDKVYAYMGLFLANVCSTVNPEVVVIGGGVSKAGDMLVKGVEPYFHKHVFHAAGGAKFTMASLGNDAGAYGAFKLALDAFGA
ncbi:MAG: ROK family glucokinase [Oscillospiraceae bacterium]|nr:ROK family glucokinase [Oscillospiraceae bacterium]